MTLLNDFKKFMFRGNVVDLAVAVVIGGAFSKIVSAFVDDLVMPAVAPLLPGGNWREATITPLNFKIGHLVGTLLDFIIVATVIFLVLVKFVGALRRKDDLTAPTPPATRNCPECLEAVPSAARRCKFCTSALVAIALVLFGGVAYAQPAPKFDHQAAAPEAKPAVEWAAQVKAGLMFTGGNAQSTAGNLNLNLSRRAGDNRFALDALAAYGRSNNRVFTPASAGDPALIESDAEITRQEVLAANMMAARARYDRFFTEKNAAYVSSGALRDRVAGKKLFGGGQAGYSRLLLTTPSHEVVSEIGYDFTYESYFAEDAKSVAIHSARVFLGEVWKVSDDTGVYANVEALFNLNRETNALDASVTRAPSPVDPTMTPAFDDKGVAPLKDTRFNGKAGLTTKLGKNVSFGFGFTLRYDQNPALLDAKFGPGYRAFANKVDVITDASLIISLL